jgi:hypothetical protein
MSGKRREREEREKREKREKREGPVWPKLGNRTVLAREQSSVPKLGNS